jgi:ATP-binding cassette subfamily B protein
LTSLDGTVRNQKVVRYFLRSLRYLRPHGHLAVWSLVLLLSNVAVALLLPWPIKFIVDNALEGQPLTGIWGTVLRRLGDDRAAILLFFAVLGFVLVLIQNLLTVVASYVNTTLDQTIMLDVRSHTFQHVLSLSMTAHDQRRSGMLIYCINSLCDGPSRLLMSIPPLVQNLLTLIGMFVILLLMNAKLALISVAILPFLYASIRHYVRYIQPRLYRVKGLEGESLAVVHEAVSMFRVIVAFGREGFEYLRFRKQAETAVAERIRLTVRQTAFSLSVNVITAAGTALVLWFGASAVLGGRLTLGELLVVLAYIAAVYKPLEAISTTIGGLQDVFVNLDISFNLLDQQSDVRELPGAVPLRRPAGSRGGCEVICRGVSFSYAGRADTLRDVTFRAAPGQVIAIVGPTGAGKTTLVSLLPRFYDTDGGQILLDGMDIRSLTLASLRQQFSVVLQEPLLFSGSILENIRYGRPTATFEEVMDAARSANAHEFIVALPQGYDTELGERGAKLSGGERQRIAVARAFVKDAPILILDEPTSSIDSKTEAVILDALDRLMEGRTTFMIAHRLSTVRRADRILVVEGGRVVEQGTHPQLLVKDGLYKQLYDMQNRHVRGRRDSQSRINVGS